MATGDLDGTLYFILINDEPVDWTTDIKKARRRTEADDRRFVRYSYDPMERKPFERISVGEHQKLDDMQSAK